MAGLAAVSGRGAPGAGAPAALKLPEPRRSGRCSLEEALSQRRSVREYAGSPATLAEVAQLLWAAQGITAPEGRRSAPSAGALYPLEIYVVSGQVEGLAPGVYKYLPAAHALRQVAEGDRRRDLAPAALEQSCVREAPLVLVLAGVYARTSVKYGSRAPRYVHMEAGHAAQNVCLQATALALGSVPVGAFEDARVRRVAGLEEGEEPLYLLPVGRR